MCLKASGQPPGMSEVEAARVKALQAGDAEAAARAELAILTSLLAAQFGPARVDSEQVGWAAGTGSPGRALLRRGRTAQELVVCCCKRCAM